MLAEPPLRLLALAVGLACCACDARPPLPSATLDPARGRAEAAAIVVSASAASVAAALDSAVPRSCRRPLEVGPYRVETHVVYTRKVDGLAADRVEEAHIWERDADGDVAFDVVVRTRLPDGRPIERSESTRLVDGRFYRAIDGRFAEADRVPEIAATLAGAAHGAGDAIFSMIAIEGGVAVPAAGEGLCTTARPVGLRSPDRASARIGARRRTAEARWQLQPGAHVIVTLDERRTAVRSDVVAPETVWAVEADDSVRATESFVALGRAVGWLQDP